MSLSDVLAAVPPELVNDVSELVRAVVSAPSPAEAVQRAKAAVLTDAADAATDAALRHALDREVNG